MVEKNEKSWNKIAFIKYLNVYLLLESINKNEIVKSKIKAEILKIIFYLHCFPLVIMQCLFKHIAREVVVFGRSLIDRFL